MQLVEGPLPPPYIGPFMQWEMAKDPREREVLETYVNIPMHWNGLLRLGYMNAIYYNTDVNQQFMQWKMFEALMKNVRREQKHRYFNGFYIYHTLWVRAFEWIEARLIGAVVERIASFIVNGARELRFFRLYIGHRDRASIITSYTGRYRAIAV